MGESPLQVSNTQQNISWRRLDTFVPLFVALVAYAIAALLLARNLDHFDGDEPHYALITESLCRDRDADLRNNYEAKDYLAFYPHAEIDPHAYDYRGTGELRSFHGIGLPILLTLPHCVLGHPYWARLEMAALAALASWSIFLTIRNWTESSRLAYVTWAATTFTVPMWTLAPQLYPDVVAVLGVALALQLFLSRPLTPGKTLGIGLVVGALPWFHVRFALLGLLVAATTGIHLLRARRGWKTLACLLVPPALGGLLWMWNSYIWYGGILPGASYQPWSQHMGLFSWDRLYVALADIVLGREFGLLIHAPIYLVALVGLVMMILRRESFILAPFIWLLGYIASVTLSQAVFQSGWGYYFPARLVLPVVPILALPLAYAIRQTCWLRLVALALFLISVTISVQSLLQPYKAIANQNGVSELPLLRPVQSVFPALQDIQQGAELDMSGIRHDTGALTHDQTTNAPILLADPRVDEPGLIVLGPYLAFQTGSYTATVTLRRGEAEPSAVVARIDMITGEGTDVLAVRDVRAGEFSAGSAPQDFSLSFFTRDTRLVQARVYYTGQSQLVVQSIRITPQADRPAPAYPGLLVVAGWALLVIAAGLLATTKPRTAGTEPPSPDEPIQ